jgi:23S rRNA (guanosine2251-2'-O)-methyltransferase
MRSSQSLIIGRKPLLEALQQGKEFDKILLQQNIAGELVGDILRAAKANNTPIQRVPLPKLQQLSKQNHQGVIGLGALVHYLGLQDVIDHLFAAGKTPRFVYIDGVTDVRNIGAIARTAMCFDFDAVIVTERGNASINEDAVKASAGAVLQIPIVRERHNEGVLELLQHNGIAIYASSLQAKKSLSDIDFTGPCAVVMGSEEQGISLQVSKACTEQFLIPMSNAFDSLNVSVATGIICSHVYNLSSQ